MPCTRALVLALFAALASSASAQAHEYRELRLADGEALRYAVGLPDGYDPTQAYPLLLALPPGAQDEAMVEAGFERYWGAPARAAGWVVVSPVAPTGESFWSGAERLVPPLLTHIRETFRVAQGRMHLAGASNGGRSAFRIATLHAHEFQTLTVLPGFPPAEDDARRLARLAGMRVRLFVGGDDGAWVTRSQDAAARLGELGVDVELRVLPGEGHVPTSLDGGVLMEELALLHAASAPVGREAGVSLALDDLHDAAAKGDEARYFGRFAPEAVFLGTDAGERWTLEQFRAFALPYFQRPSAWIYVPQSRHVALAPDGTLAWFDELLGHARFGTCRGSGVLRLLDGDWRVAQYNLSVPVPNDLMEGVVARIRAFADGASTGSTTVFLVRHAEKDTRQCGADPPLSEAGRARAERLARLLRSAELDAVYTSELRRTKDTVAPLCAASHIEPTVVPAADVAGLARRLRGGHAGERVLVAGHSNTLPAILRALGVAEPADSVEPVEPIEIGEGDYDNLFVVLLEPAGARLVRLHFD